MENLFTPFIRDKSIVIIDGAMATELEARGADLNHSLWSAKLLKEDPQLIQQVHYDYLLAGADIVTTASYQASFTGFAKQGYSHAVAAAFMQLSVQLALNARTALQEGFPERIKPLVAASVGPYGASLADGSEYRGNYGVSIEHLKDFHRERMRLLSQSGADLLAFETIPCKDEAEALIAVLEELPGVQAWISFSSKDAAHVSSGEDFAACIELINHCPQIIAAGVNCTAPQYIESLIKIAVSVTDKYIIVYPNKGDTWDAASKCWIPAAENHQHFKTDAAVWYTAGARLIGGCCRTTPEDIRGLGEMGDRS